MYNQENLLDLPNYQNDLIFYKVMNYPIPSNPEFFLFEHKLDNLPQIPNQETKSFSWHKKNELINEYLHYINKYSWLYRSLPFVKHIYLCNSITFNALKENSDIDLFIVCKRGAMWRARFFSAFLFFVLGLKRSLNKKTKKFCLSFYVTESATNLYSISLPKTDIYLSYWLAHLIPLYQEHDYNIYQDNQRLVSNLPNFPQQHIINLGIRTLNGLTYTKKTLQLIFGGIIGYFFEKIIRLIWLPIVLYKTKKHNEDARGIIISDNILKFHLDIRKKVRLNYTLRKKGIHKTLYGIRED